MEIELLLARAKEAISEQLRAMSGSSETKPVACNRGA